MKFHVSFSFIANIIAPKLPWVSLQMIMEIAKSPLFFLSKSVATNEQWSPADWFQIDIKLEVRKMAVSIVICTLSVNHWIIKILRTYFPNS